MRLTLTRFDPTTLAPDPAVVRQFDQDSVAIGRAGGNDWVLPTRTPICRISSAGSSGVTAPPS